MPKSPQRKENELCQEETNPVTVQSKNGRAKYIEADYEKHSELVRLELQISCSNRLTYAGLSPIRKLSLTSSRAFRGVCR